MMQLIKHWQSFTHYIFPFQCVGCQCALDFNEETLCNACAQALPLTHYWKDKDNAIAQMFWGKMDVEHACSFLYFYQGGRVQNLLHALKYQGRRDSGKLLGQRFGEVLKSSVFSSCDAIIPVPLHPKKIRKRGYNQCTVIASGMSDTMHLPLLTNTLERIEHHESQTKKGRYERWLNVKTKFKVANPSALKGKHVLLVDDVITTGATLEACASTLLAIPQVRISLATIACPAPF